MRVVSYRELGIYWSYPIDGKKRGKKIVMTGIYSRVRHPVYMSFGLVSAGFALVLLDWVMVLLSILAVAGLVVQALEEERLLVDQFGDVYTRYMTTTGRFFPSIRHA